MQDYTKDRRSYDDAIVIDVKTIINNLWRCITRYWIIMLFVIVLSTASTIFLGAKVYQPRYKATIFYVVSKTGDSTLDVVAAKYMGAAFEELLEGAGLGQDIADALGYKTYEEIPGQITGEYLESINMISISVVADTYEKSKEILDITKELYPDYASKAVGSINLKVIENTPDTLKPLSSFSMSYYGGAGLALGVAICFICVFIYSINNRMLQSKSDVEKITNMQCLTQLPKIKVRSGQDIKSAKGYEMIQQAIRTMCYRINQKNDNAQVFVLTSSNDKEGKSTIAHELGSCLSQFGKKTVIFNMNLNSSSDIEKEGTVHTVTFTSSGNLKKRKKRGNAKSAVFRMVNVKENLCVLSFLLKHEKGGMDAALSDEKLNTLFLYLRSHFEYIVIDSTPIGMTADALTIGKYTDQIIYVVKQGAVTEKQLNDGIEVLQENGLIIRGYILNFADSGIIGDGKYGRYGLYNKYGYSKYYNQSEDNNNNSVNEG